MAATLKTQLNSITSRITKVEKKAEKQIKQALKSSEKFKKQQLKNVQTVIRQARKLKKMDLIRQAEKVRREIEGRATKGMIKIMDVLNLPSKKEIGRLSRKVGALQKRLDQIEKQRNSR